MSAARRRRSIGPEADAGGMRTLTKPLLNARDASLCCAAPRRRAASLRVTMSAASDLTTASWHSFNRLLDQALELPTDQRLAWIDALGPEHDALKPALRALFERASGVETAWLATLPREAASALIDASDLKPDTRIGWYRLVRELGTGGMGTVWLAEPRRWRTEAARRAENATCRVVYGLAERMARERDILAALEHPNIARLYDAGTDSHGRPSSRSSTSRASRSTRTAASAASA